MTFFLRLSVRLCDSPAMKKLSWKFIARALPDIDHPELNMLRNSGGRCVDIPVTLYKDDAEVFTADVRMLSSAAQLNQPALWILLQHCENMGIDLDWDRVSFTNPHVRFEKDAIMKKPEHAISELIQAYPKHGLNELLEVVLDDTHSTKHIADRSELSEQFNQVARKIAAVFQLHSAEIISEDFESLKRDRKWSRRAVKGIKGLLGL